MSDDNNLAGLLKEFVKLHQEHARHSAALLFAFNELLTVLTAKGVLSKDEARGIAERSDVNFDDKYGLG